MKQKLRASIFCLSILGNFIFLPKTMANLNSNLSVRLDGLKNQKGQVCLTIFSSNKGFPDNSKKAIKSQCSQVKDKVPALTFAGLKAGSYAVAVIHDINGDGILNRNVIGIPTEGFGFSNNPVIRTGPPKFGESAVLVAGPNTNIQIQLQYLFGS